MSREKTMGNGVRAGLAGAATVAGLMAVTGTAVAANPVITDPRSENQMQYPLIVSSDVGPGEVAGTGIGCEIDPVTGQRDTRVRYQIITTGSVEVVSSAISPTFVFVRASGGEDGGTLRVIVICERAQT
jgi:hypothetical protein